MRIRRYQTPLPRRRVWQQNILHKQETLLPRLFPSLILACTVCMMHAPSVSSGKRVLKEATKDHRPQDYLCFQRGGLKSPVHVIKLSRWQVPSVQIVD
jgi:hypothetical protein